MVSMFLKRASCPSSQELLGYHLSSLTDEQRSRVQAHLLSCDFCNAELQLLTRHRVEVEEDALVEMPAPLRRLAEPLLRRSAAAFGELSELVNARQLSH
jgi:anti-sigma factor RsiW